LSWQIQGVTKNPLESEQDEGWRKWEGKRLARKPRAHLGFYSNSDGNPLEVQS
jgi:hypothetical protein